MLRQQLLGVMLLPFVAHWRGVLSSDKDMRHHPVPAAALAPPQKELVFAYKAVSEASAKAVGIIKSIRSRKQKSKRSTSLLTAKSKKSLSLLGRINRTRNAVRKSRRPAPWLQAEAQDAFLQRSAVHKRTLTWPVLYTGRDPRPVEDMDLILGVPKIIWVILADVIALAGFLSCIPLMMYLSKRPEDDDEPEGCCAGFFGCTCCGLCGESPEYAEEQPQSQYTQYGNKATI